ncbi:TATA element modulatory factor 1 TATA binding-domain-containing protein [Corynascus similis CBS 632.67]
MAARWGSLLSQAVAGVEARLDNILADNEDETGQQKETKSEAPPSPAKQSPSSSRAASSARTNDRLQERLARAMAAKAAARGSMSTQGSPRQSLDALNRSSIDGSDRSSPTPKESTKETPSPRGSQDIARTSLDGKPPQKLENEGSSVSDKEVRDSEKEPDTARRSGDLSDSVPSIPSTEPAIATPEPKSQEDTNGAIDRAGEEELAKDGHKNEDPHLQHQEEIHGYVERIDALEAKLQFLAREATDSARKAALAAPAGSAEKKLAEKDQQIAQLIEEGRNLASADHKQRAMVKRLRASIAENEKELNALRTAKSKADKEVENLRTRARRVDELEKAHNDLQKRLDQRQKELNTLRPEIRTKDTTIAELRSQLQKATEQADALTAKVNEEAREKDKQRIAELEEEVAALKVEKTLITDRGKAQATELREKAERANERARALELELKAEVQVMESKLEAMRVRAEEASSGVAGDSQAKLLRQVETLQTQYSIASENWQGIETTLLARITGLERERDEALQRESDMRRKAREAAARAKRQEEELEEAKTKIPTIQEDVKSYQSQLDALKKRAEEAESALAKAKAEFEKEKQAWEAEKEERQLRDVPERPRSWLEGIPGGSFLKPESRPASPQLSTPQRTFSTDFLGITLPASKSRKPSGPSSKSDAGAGAFESRMPFSRRPSGQPPSSRPTLSSNPSGSGVFSPPSVFSPISDAAPSHHPDGGIGSPLEVEVQRGEDAFEGGSRGAGGIIAERSASPQQMLQDMVSVSTVAAGPSVQLVERMSAAIRRLESEKVAAREELARISRQRDDARGEIVALMREAEAGKAAAKRVEALESEVAEVKERYETTLELLGEKSELVEELRADIDDVKAMYRDLVERTIK